MKNISLGIILGVLLSACAGFSYKYYGVEMPGDCYDKGMLLGKTPNDDLPLSTCKPDDVTKLKCITLQIDEFYALKADYERCVVELKACQKACSN